MSSDAVVSVICSTYNHEKYVRDALEGFVMQKTTFPFEVLIHDDASTDRTQDIIREYEAKYPELIKPIYQTENQYQKPNGVFIIKGFQTSRAGGKYVAFCEGDDYWTDPLKLQKQYDFMEGHPDYTLCGCSTQWLNMLTGKVENKSRTEQDVDLDLKGLVLPKNGRPFPYVSFFMKADTWKNVPIWGFPAGDLQITYYAAIAGKVRMLADNMCVYRWYAKGSWTARNGDEKMRAETCAKMIRGFENMDRDTNHQYEELIKRRIRALRYTKALMEHDFDAIRSGELLEIYRQRDLLHRLSDRMRCQAPGAYRIVQRIVGYHD